MSADRISYDTKGQFFSFDGQYGFNGRLSVDRGVAYVTQPADSNARYHKLTASALGKIVAKALIGGAAKIQFDTVTVSVNYIVQMLGFTGKNGWFTDLLSSTTDHAFDANHPTPGYFVGQARELQSQASELEQYARLARSAYRSEEAGEAETQATQLRSQARRLLTQE